MKFQASLLTAASPSHQRLSCYAGDGQENEAEILAENGGSDGDLNEVRIVLKQQPCAFSPQSASK